MAGFFGALGCFVGALFAVLLFPLEREEDVFAGAAFFFTTAFGCGFLAVGPLAAACFAATFAGAFFFTGRVAFDLAAVFFFGAELFTTRILAAGRAVVPLLADFLATGFVVRFEVTDRSVPFFLGASFLPVIFPLATGAFFTSPFDFLVAAPFLVAFTFPFLDDPPVEALTAFVGLIPEVLFFLAIVYSKGKGARKGKQIPLPCKSMTSFTETSPCYIRGPK
ncbi:MAG: hypothetical protein ABI373_02560 [Flavobacteriales bacterium]